MAKMTYETYARDKDRLKMIGYVSTGIYSQRAADILMFVRHCQNTLGGVTMRVGSKLNSFFRWLGMFTQAGEKVFIDSKHLFDNDRWDVQVDDYGEVLIRLGDINNFRTDCDEVISKVKEDIDVIHEEMTKRGLSEVVFIPSSTYAFDMTISLSELKGISDALSKNYYSDSARAMIGYPSNPIEVMYNKSILNKTAELKLELRKLAYELREHKSTEFNGKRYTKMRAFTRDVRKFFAKHINDNYSTGNYPSYYTFTCDLNRELFSTVGIDL